LDPNGFRESAVFSMNPPSPADELVHPENK